MNATITPATWYPCPDGCGRMILVAHHEANDQVWCYCGKHHLGREITKKGDQK